MPAPDPKTATLAVKPCRKLRPPTGPISPAQNAPASGTRPEEIVDERGVVVGATEEPGPAPVAREQQRGVAVDRCEEQPEVLVGRGRVAHLELHGLADLEAVADGERTVVLVDAEQVADEEVAATELEAVLVDDDAEMQPAAHQLALVVVRGEHEILQAAHRGLPRELVEQVPLGPSDRERLADRAAALRHDGSYRHVVGQQHRDGAGRGDVRVGDDAVAAGAGGRRREPADDGEVRHLRVDEPQEVRDRERVRIGEQQERATRRDGIGPTQDHETVFGLHRVERERVDAARAEARREHRQRGCVLDLTASARDRDRGRPEHGFGLEQLAEAARHVLERADVMRRREANEQVGTFPVESLEDLARHFAHRLDGQRVQRQGRCVAVHEIHTPGFDARRSGT